MRAATTLVFALALACRPGEPITEAEDAPRVDIHDLRGDLGERPVIDIRTPREFAAGHVPGAINIPLERLLARPDLAPDEAFLVCESGRRSARAQAALASEGRRLIDVLGGTAAWRSAGFPLQR